MKENSRIDSGETSGYATQPVMRDIMIWSSIFTLELSYLEQFLASKQSLLLITSQKQ